MFNAIRSLLLGFEMLIFVGFEISDNTCSIVMFTVGSY